MRGVVLAGGTGSRLYPLTKVVNKHLLPVYDKPMIYYPIKTLVDSGVDEILLVTGRGHEGNFMEYLGSGSEFGANISFAVQEGPKGIADALNVARDFSKGDELAVILGDNIFEKPLDLKGFKGGARIFLREVSDPHRFGIAELKDNKIVDIVEKPADPQSSLAVTGAYLFDNGVFERIEKLKASKRYELEITDVNRGYLLDGQLDVVFIDGFWVDAGTFETLFEAGQFIRTSKK